MMAGIRVIQASACWRTRPLPVTVWRVTRIISYSIEFDLCASEQSALDCEEMLIAVLAPTLNRAGKGGRAIPTSEPLHPVE